MGLQLPYTITGAQADPDAVQGNFDALKKQFPLGRSSIKLETPNVVGAAGEPAVFQNGWANFGGGFQTARYWKDAVGIVHLEGMIALGTVNAVAFTLPAGYLPGSTVPFGTISNSAIGRVDITSAGLVIPATPSSNVWVVLDGLHFKQEH